MKSDCAQCTLAGPAPFWLTETAAAAVSAASTATARALWVPKPTLTEPTANVISEKRPQIQMHSVAPR